MFIPFDMIHERDRRMDGQTHRHRMTRGGSTFGPGGTGHPKCLPAPPQYFGSNSKKYVFVKSRLFLYSGEINTRIS